MRPLRILTWHVHGNYLWYLTQVPHEFYVVCDAQRSAGRSGRSGTLPWGENVHDAPIDTLADMPFDVVLYQSRAAWQNDRHQLLSVEQQRLPRVVIEHDPPQQHPCDERHWVDDAGTLLVQVTAFNALMWNSGNTPTTVIEHGVKLLRPAHYSGTLARGAVVINHLHERGRRLGSDVFLEASRSVPLDLFGMGVQPVGGLGEVGNAALPLQLAPYRFFFNPIRWTSLGLAIIEAMMVGLPVVALATTELAAVVRDGDTGLIDTRLPRLIDDMQRLLREPSEAAAIGARGRAMASERFGIDRFVADWMRVLAEVTA